MSSEEVDTRIMQARREITRDVLSQAEEMLRKGGVEPAPIPAKIAMPLLNYASVEEDGYLRTQWVTLLANAADPRRITVVLPSFPDVLRQLTAWDARFLRAIFDHFCERCPLQPPSTLNVGLVDLGIFPDMKEIWASLGYPSSPKVSNFGDGHTRIDVNGAEEYVSIENLCRLNLITRRSVARRPDVSIPVSEKDYQFSVADHYSLTAYGFEFVCACSRDTE
jgi:hypothetical protein